MGWPFSPTYAITIGNHVKPLVDPESIKNPWSEIPIKAQINNASIKDVFIYDLLTGLGAKADSAFEYAASEQYPAGLPNHDFVFASTGHAATLEYLKTLYGSSVRLEYHFLSQLNLLHVAFNYLQTTYNYLPFQNRVAGYSAVVNQPVYLEHLQAQIKIDEPEPGVTSTADPTESEHWEQSTHERYVPWDNPYAITPAVIYDETESTRIKLRFAWLDTQPKAESATALNWAANGAPEVEFPENMLATGYNFEMAYPGLTAADKEDFIHRHEIVVTLDSLGLDQELTYFQSKYQYNQGSILKTGYFTHPLSTDTQNTELQAIEASVTQNNVPEFMPFVFFVTHYQSLASPEIVSASNDIDRQTEQEVIEYQARVRLCQLIGMDYQEVADAIQDNPDVSDIAQAFLMFGISITSQTEYGLKYLFHFFDWLTLNTATAGGLSTGNTLEYNAHNLIYRNSDSTWYSRRKNTGSVISFTERDIRLTFKYGGVLKQAKLGVLGDVGSYSSRIEQHPHRFYKRVVIKEQDQPDRYRYETTVESVSVHIFTYQVDASRYYEIFIAYPVISYTIYSPGKERWREAYPDTGDMVIPLNKYILDEHIRGIYKQQLYTESLHLIVNSYNKTRLNFYESSTFVSFVQFIALAITIGSLGSLAKPSGAVYSAVSTVVKNEIAAIILTNLINLTIQVGLQAVLSYAAARIGGKNTSIAGALAFAAIAYQTLSGQATDSRLVLLANGLMQAGSQQYTIETLELQEALSDFIEQSDTELEELYSADAQKETMALIRSIGLLNVSNPFETAEEYYIRNRSGVEVNTAILDIPSTFVEQSLQLPSLSKDFWKTL